MCLGSYLNRDGVSYKQNVVLPRNLVCYWSLHATIAPPWYFRRSAPLWLEPPGEDGMGLVRLKWWGCPTKHVFCVLNWFLSKRTIQMYQMFFLCVGSWILNYSKSSRVCVICKVHHIWNTYNYTIYHTFRGISWSFTQLQVPSISPKLPEITVSTSQSPPSPHSFAPVSHAYRHNGSQWSYDFLHPVARRRPSNWAPQKYPGGSHGVTSCAHVGVTEALHTPTQKLLDVFKLRDEEWDFNMISPRQSRCFFGVGWWVFPAIPEGRGWFLGIMPQNKIRRLCMDQP